MPTIAPTIPPRSTFQSVPAEAWRPTGPAAAQAEPPIWNLFWSSWRMPSSFHVDELHILNANLGAPTSTADGEERGLALQLLFGSRHVETPRPCLAPTTNPPFSMLGTMAMDFAPESTSFGMPLSGAALISWRVLAALSSRSTASVFV